MAYFLYIYVSIKIKRMSLIELIKEKFKSQEKESDLDNIQVDSRGTVNMESEDLFNEDKESFDLIDKLTEIIEKNSEKSMLE